MTRMRTQRTNKCFSVSYLTAQDNSLSFEALGLLTYCLSMPGDWHFYPKLIWKQRKCGRDSIYTMFNELISSYHCIRIRKPNPKAKNLPGEIEYEIFDDVEICKEKIIELEKTEKFLDHGGNLNKCFRHPAFQDPEGWDPKEPYNTEERTEITKKETTTEAQAIAAVFSDKAKPEKKSRVYPVLEPLDIQVYDKEEITRDYSEADTIHGVKYALHPEIEIKTCLAATIKWACKNKPAIPINKSEYEAANRAYAVKYDGIDTGSARIEVFNRYVEIVLGGQAKSHCFEYADKGFITKFTKALKQYNLPLVL